MRIHADFLPRHFHGRCQVLGLEGFKSQPECLVPIVVSSSLCLTQNMHVICNPNAETHTGLAIKPEVGL